MAKLSSTHIFGDLVVDGQIKNIATTEIEGVVKLNDSVTSDSIAEAATANAVKTAYDKANHDHPYAEKTVATILVNGLMSSNDKIKLDTVAMNANNYIHPSTTGYNHIPMGGTIGQILRWDADGKAIWGDDNNTTYSIATSVEDGLISAIDKAKLDSVDVGANKIVLNSTVTSTSETEAATANAVKTAYDKANHSHPYAATNHGTHVNYGESTSPLINNVAGTPGVATTVSRSDHTHALPTSFPANGGNADTVDGKHASDFATSLHTHNEYSLTTHTHDFSSPEHTHNYAGSSSPGGSATSAIKLATARTINNVSFDGTTNIVIADNTKLSLAGGTLTGTLALKLGSNTLIGQGITTGNTQLIGTNETTICFGNSRTNIVIEASSNPAVSIGGISSILYHTGNKPTYIDVGAAPTTHTHNYAATTHTHDIYALTEHAHNDYSLASHTHSNYSLTTHGHKYAGSTTDGGSATTSLACTGNAATASQLKTAVTINGISFDGSSSIIVTDSTKLSVTGGTLTGAINFANNAWNKMGDDVAIGDCNQAGKLGIKGLNGSTGLYFMPYSGTITQSITTDGVGNLTISGNTYGSFFGNISGNANTASKLLTAINMTIGSKTYSFDGSSSFSFTLAEIGAAASNHIHDYAASLHKHSEYAFSIHDHDYAATDHSHSNYSLATHTHTGFAPSVHTHDYAATIHSHNEYSLTSHGHNYAGASIDGGSANSALVCTGNSATATKLATTRNITVGATTRSFDGSGSIAFTLTDIGAANSSHVHTEYAINTHIHSEYAILEHTHNYASTTHTHNYAASSTPGGSATSALKLNTGRKITIGNKINVFDGSTDINFTLTDIGAAASSHIHDYAANNHNHNQIICADITQLDNYDGLTIADSNISSSDGYDSNYSQIINIKSASGTTQIINETEWEEPTLKVRQRYLDYEWGPFYKIYHSGSKPTPSEIGAALSNHAHNNYAPGKVGTGENSIIFNANTNKANGLNAIAQGGDTSASGICSHAEGNFTVAAGDYSHAEGIDTRTFASAGHAEGSGTMAVGAASHTEGTNSTAWAQNSHAEGYDTQTSGAASHAEGNGCVASGNYSHVEGDGSQSDGQSSHAEGQECISAELGSHAEGGWTEANGEFSHAEGNGSYANGANSHAEGEETKTWGTNSHSEGKNTTAIGEFSHIEGGSSYNLSTVIPGLTGTETSTVIESKWIANSSPGSPSAKSFAVAYGSSSHVEGWNCIALGSSAHAEGFYSFAKGIGAHAEGCLTVANGTYSHAKGHYSIASGFGSYAEGGKTNAIGDYTHTEGYGTTAETYNVHVQGRYNKVNSGSDINYAATQNAFVIGNGTSSTVLSNAFRVTFNGKTYALSAFNSTGADYAEYFEWQDGNPNNEDRIGLFVTLDENKIKIANSINDYIIGVISGNASIIGNSNEDGWNEMYARDMFGRFQYEDVEVHETKQGVEKLIDEIHIEKRIKLNPNYDPSKEYKPRSERQEWDAVGMLGQIPVIDNGTCEPNGFCTVSNGGIATKSSTGYRVTKRLSDNIVLIIFK